jgi:hypothetical protein
MPTSTSAPSAAGGCGSEADCNDVQPSSQQWHLAAETSAVGMFDEMTEMKLSDLYTKKGSSPP